MRVRPAAGKKVRHPITKQHIGPEGVEIQPNTSTYFHRRIRSGDMEPVAMAKEPVVTVNDIPIPDSDHTDPTTQGEV